MGSYAQTACLSLSKSHRMFLGKAVLALQFHRCISLQAASCLLPAVYMGTPQKAKCLSCCSSSIFLCCATVPGAAICLLLGAGLLQLPAEPLGPETCKSPSMWLQKLSALCSLEMKASATARGTIWGWGGGLDPAASSPVTQGREALTGLPLIL